MADQKFVEHVEGKVVDRREFVLAKAILIYQEQVFKQEQFATVHDVVHDAQTSHPRRGPGSLLSKSFLRKLCVGLERGGDAGTASRERAGLHV